MGWLQELQKETNNKLLELIQSAEEASEKLHDLADEIDEHFRNCNKGKIAGTAASLAGFPLMAIGFGLSFVTFGASLGLTIAGAALSGAGGITAAGSGLAEHFITKAKCKEAQEAVDVVQSKAKAFQYCLDRIKRNVPSTDDFLSDAYETGKLVKSVGFTVRPLVSNGLKLAAGVADDGIAAVVRGMGKLTYIGGFVLSALIVPYDIYTLATLSIKEHRNIKSEEANKIRKLAREMQSLAEKAKSA